MEKILIIQSARFGDLLQTRRLIKSLEATHETHLALAQSFLPLAAELYPGIKLHGFPFHSVPDRNGLADAMRELAILQKTGFSRIYNCNYSALSSNLCRLFPGNMVLGLRPGHYSGGDILRSAWARLVFRLVKKRRITPLNLVDYWGWFSKSPISGDLVNPGAKPGGKGLGVVIAGQESRRSLPPEILGNIITTTANIIKPCGIYLLGTKAELQASHGVMRQLPAKILNITENLCGKTGWHDLIETVKGLDLLLTPDTGTMHLAAFLGTPVMAFFLSSALCHETGPYGKGHLIWQSVPSCSPCLESAPCGNSLKCLAPFRDESFSRHLAGALTGNKNLLKNLPPTLQLWETGFNETGQELKLRAGKDEVQMERKICASLIGNFLLEKNFEESVFPPELLEELTEELFPEQEWMLPPRRYC